MKDDKWKYIDFILVEKLSRTLRFNKFSGVLNEHHKKFLTFYFVRTISALCWEQWRTSVSNPPRDISSTDLPTSLFSITRRWMLTQIYSKVKLKFALAFLAEKFANQQNTVVFVVVVVVVVLLFVLIHPVALIWKRSARRKRKLAVICNSCTYPSAFTAQNERNIRQPPLAALLPVTVNGIKFPERCP